MKLAVLVCSLVLLSCARTTPPPTETTSPAAKLPPYGDGLDDDAWRALGPRPDHWPTSFPSPMRLEDYWLLDPGERSQRERYAMDLTRQAEARVERRPEEALDLYLDAIRMAPMYLPPWPQAVRILLRQDQVQRAQALTLQYARLAEGEDGLPWLLRGLCEERLGHMEEARQCFTRAVNAHLHPQSQAAVSLALLSLQEGDVHAAESLRTRYAIQDPMLDLLLQERQARARGDMRTAADALEQIVDLPNAPVGIWEELASLEFEQGRYDAARHAYERAARETPERSAPLVGLARLDIVAGQYERAAARLQRVVEREPDNLAAQFNLGTALLERVRSSSDEVPEADALLRRAEQAWSQCIEAGVHPEAALWGRAEARLRRGDLSSAFFDAEQLHEIAHDIPAANTRWARLLATTGHRPEARDALRQAARHDELDHDGRALLARLEDPAEEDALDLLRQVFAEDPTDAATGMRLGVALLLDGELEEAESVMRAVVALRPDDPNALQNLAAVLDRRGRYREAQELLQRAESLR